MPEFCLLAVAATHAARRLLRPRAHAGFGDVQASVALLASVDPDQWGVLLNGTINIHLGLSSDAKAEVGELRNKKGSGTLFNSIPYLKALYDGWDLTASGGLQVMRGPGRGRRAPRGAAAAR